MGVLSSLIERRSAPNTSSREWFVRWGGGTTDAGVYVDETTALNSLVVMACVRILAETLASLPAIVYRRLDERGRDRAREHSLYSLLRYSPNAEMTAFTYFERMMSHLALWGNHYSIIQRQRGDVVALWPIHPGRVTIERGSDQQLIYRIGESRYPAHEVLHIPGLAMDGPIGLSPLAAMRQAIGITVAAETYGARFFANDARPNVLLKHPAALSDQAREHLRNSWAELHGQGRGGVAILEEGMEFAAIGMPPEDAQFIETRRFQVQEFARFFRIPPHLLADVERSTSWGTGIEQQNIGFVVYTMRPWLVRIEQELMRKLLAADERQRYYVEFLVDGLLRGDSKSRAESYAIGRQWGWMSANDVRELENQNPIEGGDLYLHPMNMVTGEQAEQAVSGGTSVGGERSAVAVTRVVDAERQQRSVDSRYRIAESYVRLLSDVFGRLIRIERNEVRAMLRKHDLAEFEQVMRDYYYEKFPAKVIEYGTPAIRALVEATSAECVLELDGITPDDDAIELWVDEYVAVMAKRHCGSSRSRLLAVLGQQERADQPTSTAETIIDLLEAELDSWDERVEAVAEAEAHRAANASSRWTYQRLGVLRMRWRVMGPDPCEWCQQLDGRVVGPNESFVSAGQSLFGAAGTMFLSRGSIKHPPLHRGCKCVILPG